MVWLSTSKESPSTAVRSPYRITRPSTRTAGPAGPTGTRGVYGWPSGSTLAAVSSWSYGVILAIAGVAAVVLLVDLVRDRSAQDAHFIALGLLELATVVQLVGGSVAL